MAVLKDIAVAVFGHTQNKSLHRNILKAITLLQSQYSEDSESVNHWLQITEDVDFRCFRICESSAVFK